MVLRLHRLLLELMGRFYAGRKKLGVALSYYLKVRKLIGTDAQNETCIARVLFDLHRLEEAETILTYVRESCAHSDTFEARDLLASIFYSTGRYRECLPLLVALTDDISILCQQTTCPVVGPIVKKGYATTLIRLGFTYIKLEEWDEASDAFARCEKIAPLDPWLAVGRGHCLSRAGCVEEAVASYRKAVEIAPENEVAAVSLAECLSSMGAFGESQAILKRLLAVQPNAMEARSLLSKFEDRGGNKGIKGHP